MPGLTLQTTHNLPGKVIEVRTLKRGRSKSIVVPNASDSQSSKGRIGRLNNYNSKMKKHRGSLCLGSDLGSIEEEAESSKRQFPNQQSNRES